MQEVGEQGPEAHSVLLEIELRKHAFHPRLCDDETVSRNPTMLIPSLGNMTDAYELSRTPDQASRSGRTLNGG